MADQTVAFSAVVEQFRASEELLEQARERLRSIALSGEGAADAQRSLSEGASAVQRAVESLEAVVGSLDGARQATVDALAAAQRFLDGTDLSALRTAVEGQREALQSTVSAPLGDLRKSVDAQETALAKTVNASLAELRKELAERDRSAGERIAGLQAAVDALAERTQTVEAANAKYEKLLAQIPERVRKKMRI